MVYHETKNIIMNKDEEKTSLKIKLNFEIFISG